jgi:hypothetical protein
MHQSMGLAIAAGISFIITNNASGFAQEKLKSLGYEVITQEQLLWLL